MKQMFSLGDVPVSVIGLSLASTFRRSLSATWYGQRHGHTSGQVKQTCVRSLIGDRRSDRQTGAPLMLPSSAPIQANVLQFTHVLFPPA